MAPRAGSPWSRPATEDDSSRGSRSASGSRRATVQVGEELSSGPVTCPEQTEHVRGRHDRPWLAHATHDRAQVGGLEHDADALWVEPFLEELGDLLGQPLVALQPAPVHLDDVWAL